MTSLARSDPHRRGFSDSIAGRITLRMLFVAAIPALIVGAVTVGVLFALAGRADDELAANRAALADDTIGARHAEQARLLVASVDTFFEERLGDAIDWSRTPVIVETTGAVYPETIELSSLPIAEVDGRIGQDQRLDRTGRSSDWLAAQIEAQPAFAQAIVTDANGFTVGAARPTTDFTSADREWWQRAWSDGVFLGAVEIDESTGVVAVPLAVRIDDTTTGAPLGVLEATVDLAAIQPLADAFADEGRGVEVRILTRSGLLLAETASDHDRARIATELPFDGQHGAAYGQALTGADETGHIILDDTVGGFGRTRPVREVGRLGTRIDNHDWVAFVEQPTSTALAPLSGLESLRSDLTATARLMAITVVAVLLTALAAALLVGRLLAKRIARPINELSYEANRLAAVELPEMVAQLQQPGAAGTVPAVEPLRVDADGEVAELAAAFDSVRTTAVGLAAEQAIGRSRDASELLTSLGRRNQQLVGRQLRFIDRLERTESDPDVLRNLFVLDQMATRMRRNAESLLVLAGEASPRRVGRARPVDEVVRAAVSEVEDYARVRLGAIDPGLITPNAVNNVTHLLAELIENAASFSPPDELVEVVGTAEPDGSYTLAVVDRGVGMSRDRLRLANERLRGAPFARGSSPSLLGLHVVGRLAARHGIDARLVESATIGTTAKVTLPPSCLSTGEMSADGMAHSRRLEPGDDAPDPALSWPPPAVRPASPGGGPSIEALTAAALDAADARDELHGLADTAPADADDFEIINVTDEQPIVGSGARLSLGTDGATQRSWHDATERPLAHPTAPEPPTLEPPTVDQPLVAVETEHPPISPPVPAPSTGADAAGPGRYEDDTVGLPIPPFRARESKRPAGAPTVGVDDRATEQIRVRRRVPRHQGSGNGALEPVSAAAIDGDAESRAAEVRARLDRFASGVRAAKGEAAVTTSPAPTGELRRVDIARAATESAEVETAGAGDAQGSRGDGELVGSARRAPLDEAPQHDERPA